MTITDRLAVVCPRCDKPGSIHCAGALCTWMECDPCSAELSRLYGMRWTVIWDSVTGKQAALPKVRASRYVEESVNVEDPRPRRL